MGARLEAAALAAQLSRVEAELGRSIPQALTLVAHMVATRARSTRLFRDRTGNLRNSIRPGRVSGSLASGFRVETLAGGTSGVAYAFFVHEGTSRMRARPFMAEAMEASREDAQRVIEQAVDLALQRAGF